MSVKRSRGRGPRLGGLMPLALALGCLAGCGSSAKSLDSAKVARAIERSILAEHHLRATVECPHRVPQESGRVFTCSARLDAGAYPVRVNEVGEDGEVRYEDSTPLVALNVAKVQRAIDASVFSQRRLHASASCPREVLQRAGVVFWCTATVDGETTRYPFRVSELDNAGHVRYVGT
jgi:hypothetical protein